MAKLVRFFTKFKKSSYPINDKNKDKKSTSSRFFSTKSERKKDVEHMSGSMVRASSLPIIPALSSENIDKRISIYSDSNNYKEGEHWRIDQMLGHGQFGVCYQALDVVTGTLMAVKQVPIIGNDAMNASSLKEEIELLGRLNHKNIVRILGATQERTHFNIFLEWMPGGSVASLLAKFGHFHEYVIIRYLKQVLTGLVYLHDKQIIHRDLKGANILVDGSGKHIRISDFGTARRLKTHTTVEGEFEGEVYGTLPFMAPEVIRGDNYGRSSDIWSVGCVVIEMATANHPWSSETTPMTNHFQLMYKIARSTAPPKVPITLSNSTRSLTQKCLHLEPTIRPSAKELLLQPVFAVPPNDNLEIPAEYKTDWPVYQSRSSSDIYISERDRSSIYRPSIDSTSSNNDGEFTESINFQIEQSEWI